MYDCMFLMSNKDKVFIGTVGQTLKSLTKEENQQFRVQNYL